MADAAAAPDTAFTPELTWVDKPVQLVEPTRLSTHVKREVTLN